jgi:hypothetical protein
MWRAVLVLAFAAAAFAMPGKAFASSDAEHDLFEVDTGTGFSVGIGWASEGVDSQISADPVGDAPVVEYLRGVECSRPGDWNYSPGCEGSVPIDFACPDGRTALEPLFSRTQNDDGSWSPWQMVTYYTCPDNSGALLATIQHEWSTLTPIPTTATIQPSAGWVYANVPTIAMAHDESQIHTSTLLGAQVDIRAIPSTYTWEWGDGEQTTTDDPGSPYPDATLTHTYAHFEGDVTLSLSTIWSGEYRINGGSWTSFGSAITSDSPPITLEVRNPHSQLVACTTDGDCQ